jgi:hypothetical protein
LYHYAIIIYFIERSSSGFKKYDFEVQKVAGY